VAKAQDLYDVLNTNYTPNTPDAVEIFKLEQNFMYAIADSTLLTEKWKNVCT
jgi:hypothetical protein